jgi:hypothetical protein
MSTNTTGKFVVRSMGPSLMKVILGGDTSSDELWSVAFSNVGRAYGDPKNQKEIAEAIQAISGPSCKW